MIDSIRHFTTPTWLLIALTILAAIALGVSQFMDYRSVAVGVDLYEAYDGVAPPPEVDRTTTGSAHGYVFVPAAILALAVLGYAIANGRWQLCRLIALIGLAAIVVGLVIDLPKGLSEGDATTNFEGAKARLLGGFWLQVISAAVLAASSFLLGGRSDAPPTRGQRPASTRAEPSRPATLADVRSPQA